MLKNVKKLIALVAAVIGMMIWMSLACLTLVTIAATVR